VKQNLSFDFRSAAVLACALLLATACSQKSSQTQATSTNKVIATVKAGDGPWGIAI